MDNNLDQSEIEIDTNSVFCPRSYDVSPERPNEDQTKFPFDKSMISTFMNEEPKALTKSSVLKGLDELNGLIDNNNNNWKFERFAAQNSIEKVLQTLPTEPWTPVRTQYSENTLIDRKRNSNDFNDLNYTKLTSSEINSSPGMFTLNKITIDPTAPQSSNIKFKDYIEDINSDCYYKHTSFYLKRFNMFSNKIDYHIYEEDDLEQPLTVLQVAKKINNIRLSRKENSFKRGLTKRNKRKVACNCKNSSCVKLYCECFSSNGFCGKNCKC